jgi:hypothetical protein
MSLDSQPLINPNPIIHKRKARAQKVVTWLARLLCPCSNTSSVPHCALHTMPTSGSGATAALDYSCLTDLISFLHQAVQLLTLDQPQTVVRIAASATCRKRLLQLQRTAVS